MKINFGCGKKVLDGFFNIDAVHNPAAPRAPELLYAAEFDRMGALKSQAAVADGAADLLQALHVIEHVYLWEVDALLAEWKRMLKPGGALVLELPNIEAAARNLLAGMNDQMCMWPLFGDPGHKDPFMCHRWGYTPNTIVALLEKAGFERIVVLAPKTHGARVNRDMRVEAMKP